MFLKHQYRRILHLGHKRLTVEHPCSVDYVGLPGIHQSSAYLYQVPLLGIYKYLQPRIHPVLPYRSDS